MTHDKYWIVIYSLTMPECEPLIGIWVPNEIILELLLQIRIRTIFFNFPTLPLLEMKFNDLY